MNKKFQIPVKYVFSGVFQVKAESENEANEMVRNHCGLVMGGNIHTTLNERDVDWQFDAHPQAIVSEEIILVELDNEDSALFVNGRCAASSEASEGDPNTPLDIAVVLAGLGHDVRHVVMDVPTDDDWSWDDVYELLPPLGPLPRFGRHDEEIYSTPRE
jgi:hypothetical protein